jgi:hypothetical protein
MWGVSKLAVSTKYYEADEIMLSEARRVSGGECTSHIEM